VRLTRSVEIAIAMKPQASTGFFSISSTARCRSTPPHRSPPPHLMRIARSRACRTANFDRKTRLLDNGALGI